VSNASSSPTPSLTILISIVLTLVLISIYFCNNLVSTRKYFCVSQKETITTKIHTFVECGRLCRELLIGAHKISSCSESTKKLWAKIVNMTKLVKIQISNRCSDELPKMIIKAI
jgi:hypothetical protein